MAAFIITVFLLSIFDITQQCSPKLDLIDNKSPLKVKPINSFENIVKKLLNATEIVREESDKMETIINDCTYNINDTTSKINQTKLITDSGTEKTIKKCEISKECDELWKRFFGKCRCQ
ncbi:hypothetical protein ACH3XW_30365 [Acanthocheilonema viteae]